MLYCAAHKSSHNCIVCCFVVVDIISSWIYVKQLPKFIGVASLLSVPMKWPLFHLDEGHWGHSATFIALEMTLMATAFVGWKLTTGYSNWVIFAESLNVFWLCIQWLARKVKLYSKIVRWLLQDMWWQMWYNLPKLGLVRQELKKNHQPM